MKKILTISRLGLIATLLFCLSVYCLGCNGTDKGKDDPVVTKKIASRPKAQKPPSPASPAKNKPKTGEAKQSSKSKNRTNERLPFDPTGKIDPFEPIFKEKPKPKVGTVSKPKKPERPRTPLERLDLGQLKLTAIVHSETRPRAMVEEDSGKGYVVEIGTYMGLERGQVTDIKRNRIVIEHLKTDDFGNTAPRRRELKLQKPPGD